MRIRKREYRLTFNKCIILLGVIATGAFLGFKFHAYTFQGPEDIMVNVVTAFLGVLIGMVVVAKIIEYEITNETKQEEKIRKQKEYLHEEMRSRTRFNN